MAHVIPFPAQGATPWNPPDLDALIRECDARQLRELLRAAYAKNDEMAQQFAASESQRRAAVRQAEEWRAAAQRAQRENVHGKK